MTDEDTITAKPRAFFRVALIVIAWTFAGLLTATETHLQLSVRGQTMPAWSLFAPAIVGMWVWALYTPVVVRLARRIRVLREISESRPLAWATFFAAHLIVVGALAVADSFVWTYLRPLIDGVTLTPTRVFAATLSFNVTAYLAVVTVTEAVDYAARLQERERAAAALARTAQTLQDQLDEAKLRALEGQMQPHFLYNTLNMIAELVHDEPDAADTMLTNLGALLRRACRESPHLVPVREEISFVRAYAEILERRYRDRVTLTLDVPLELEQHPVPAFMLQPLVENAFRHGVEKRESASLVSISVAARGDKLVVRVRDRAANDAGQIRLSIVHGPNTSEHESGGVGLGNIRQRLDVLYGSKAGVTLVRANGETVAAVWIPLERGTEEHDVALGEGGISLAPAKDAVSA